MVLGRRNRLVDARVLVVDDDSMAVSSLQRVLGRQGAEVETAMSTRTAMERIQSSSPFDAAFVDYFLVGHEGHALMRPLRRNGCCPVMISGSDREGIDREAIAQGAEMFLRKPFEVEEFLEAATAALDISRRWRRTIFQREQSPEPKPWEMLEPVDVAERLADFSDLSEKERQVLARVVLGLTNEEIAQSLRVSSSTVKYHDHRGRMKLSVESRRELNRLVLTGSRDPSSAGREGSDSDPDLG